jgi:hypothetical protein
LYVAGGMASSCLFYELGSAVEGVDAS